jgi:hypothetical protein
VARKTKYGTEERGAELTEQLDTLELLIERTKILYEQYFMGIQKIAPAQLHRDIERKIRELTQEQIRNTALRFRLTTITQKFGSYNTYWKRTMQSIEQGRYQRDINRARRKAQRQGEDIPDELLNSMPKAMRDRIRRDREKVAEVAERNEHDDEAMIFDSVPEEHDTEDWDIQRLLDGLEDADDVAPVVKPARPQVYQIDDNDDMLDDRIDELFAAITDEPSKPAPRPAPPAPAAPPARTAPPQPATQPAAPPQRMAPPPQPVQAAQARPSQLPPIERTPAPQPMQAQPVQPPPQARPPAPRPVPDIAARPPATPPRAVPDIAARPPATPPARPATPAAAARPTPAAIPPPPGMTEAETRSLYEQYRQARQLVGGEDISYDRLKQKLNEQAPRIMQQYKATGLQYDVVVKDDKVVLKASPKRGE